MKKKRYIVVALLCFFLSVKAQENRAIDITTKGIQIGQTVPDITIVNLHNYKDKDGKPATIAKLSDFKGKLLILDFWATWCKGCIESFSHSSALQKKFGDKIQILYPTSQDERTVTDFVKKHQNIDDIKLPIVSNDSNLKSLFPHRLLPHVVWIDTSSHLIQQTTSFDVTAINIENLLNKKPTSFSSKKKDIIDYNSNKPLFYKGNGGDGKILYRSLIGPYTAGLPGSTGLHKTDSIIRFYATNLDIPFLFKKALDLKTYEYPKSRIIFKGINQNDYYSSNPVGYSKRLFCYELILPVHLKSQLHKIMYEDLTNFFGLKADVETRMTDCYTLTMVNPKLLSPSTSTSSENNLKQQNQDIKYLKGQRLSNLINYLNDEFGMKPIIDETGIAFNVDMTLISDLSDIVLLNKVLSNYGLLLVSTKKNLNMLVISGPAPIQSTKQSY